MALEHILQIKDIEIPPDEEGADRPVIHQNMVEGGIQGGDHRKYTPHETYHIEGDNDDLPLQLLTAEEKVDELENVVEHKEVQIQELQN